VLSDDIVKRFTKLAFNPDPNLAEAALLIASLEYRQLDTRPYVALLDALGQEAKRRVAAAPPTVDDTPPGADPGAYARVAVLNDFLFRDQQFVGNETDYEDPRNSFLNEVLDRRTGIPITLALVYMEVARRAGVAVEGINFPGHFLVRCPDARGQGRPGLIVDAFHGGAVLSEDACRALLRRHAGEDADWQPFLEGRATKPQILARMLLNLKRIYVRMYSFPQARQIADLLVAVDPAALTELRDRGLIAYHMNDYATALRDLQTYLRLSGRTDLDDETKEDQGRIWEHVKTLHRRVASLN
jgi:regulator of sirC expression with transglutaminase-like and TPR domain